MANAIETFKKYIAKLDEVYKLSSLTSVLDGNNDLVRQGANEGEFLVPKISMQGLGDYSREKGYNQGDVTLTYETMKCNFDRGRKFNVDAMDNVETAGIAFGKLSSEFIRTKVVPEVDAFRFATYAGLATSHTKTGTISDGTALLNAISDAMAEMDENEVPAEGRYLFVTPTLMKKVESLDTTKSREALDGFAKIVKVPQSRFYTQITQKSGGVSEEQGGYEKTSESGKDINFMIISKPSVIQYTKHLVNKIISPEANQTSDGWLFFYRNYAIADAYENKLDGIYLHHVA